MVSAVEPGRGSFMRDFERWMKEGTRNGVTFCEGNLEGGSFTGDPEGYVEEGSGNGCLFS